MRDGTELQEWFDSPQKVWIGFIVFDEKEAFHEAFW